MSIKQLIDNLITVVFVLDPFMKNTLPENRLVEHIVVYDARLLWILKFRLHDLIMLIEYSALVRHEHKVVIVLFFFSWFVDQLTEGRIY